MKSSNTGTSLNAVVQTIFIVLKLCDLITWSWWWVMSPTWGGLLLVMVLLPFILWAQK